MSDQLKLQKSHYVICGYRKNPACESNASEKPNSVMTGKNKRLAIGAAKCMLDNFSYHYIEIFKVNAAYGGDKNEQTRKDTQR